MSEREFVVINEEAARTAQNMMSFNEYQPGIQNQRIPGGRQRSI